MGLGISDGHRACCFVLLYGACAGLFGFFDISRQMTLASRVALEQMALASLTVVKHTA